jgi:TRAP-type C4-dicarboxylate transport system permease small subunit
MVWKPGGQRMSAKEISEKAMNVLLILASVALLGMMLVITLNVIGRIFFRMPILGALEIAGLAGVILAAVALGFVEKEERNVVVEAVLTLVPPRMKAIAVSISLFLSLVAVSIFAWVVFDDAFYAARFKEETLVLGIWTAPFKFVWAVGILILCLFLLRNMVRSIKKVVKK